MKEKHEIEKIKWSIIPITNYKSCLLEKLKDGYKILGQVVSTPQEVDEVINNANKSLKNSLT